MKQLLMLSSVTESFFTDDSLNKTKSWNYDRYLRSEIIVSPDTREVMETMVMSGGRPKHHRSYERDKPDPPTAYF